MIRSSMIDTEFHTRNTNYQKVYFLAKRFKNTDSPHEIVACLEITDE